MTDNIGLDNEVVNGKDDTATSRVNSSSAVKWVLEFINCAKEVGEGR